MHIILGLVSGCLLMYLILKPSMLRQETLNTSIRDQNERLIQDNERLLLEQGDLDYNIKELSKHYNNLQSVVSNLNAEKHALDNNINDLHNNINQLKATAESVYDTQMEAVKKRVESDTKLEEQKMQEALQTMKNNHAELVECYQADYIKIMDEASQEVSKYIQSLNDEIIKNQNILNDVSSKTKSAIEAQKRALEESDKQAFYKIQLSALDMKEIEYLRDIVPYFRDSRPLNKIIWEGYYRRPTSDLIGRLIGDSVAIGIYKITNTGTGMSYVGQSVNIADRWKNHIKAGLGIDTPNNKLYKAMQEYGVENFTFEILELCSREQLNDKEKYWIAFYETDSFGYNLTKGGS